MLLLLFGQELDAESNKSYLDSVLHVIDADEDCDDEDDEELSGVGVERAFTSAGDREDDEDECGLVLPALASKL